MTAQLRNDKQILESVQTKKKKKSEAFASDFFIVLFLKQLIC